VTSPPKQIEIVCPQCGFIYKDWYRPSINLALDNFDEQYLEQASTSICPRCEYKVHHDVLIVREDGAWEFGGRPRTGLKQPAASWADLRKPELGRITELLFELEFIKRRWDVYRPELDRGVDLVTMSASGTRYDVQVKGRRGLPYRVLIRRKQMIPRADLLVALAIFEQDFEPPRLFLIPSEAWLEVRADSLFARSSHYWTINASGRNLPALRCFDFATMLDTLEAPGS